MTGDAAARQAQAVERRCRPGRSRRARTCASAIDTSAMLDRYCRGGSCRAGTGAGAGDGRERIPCAWLGWSSQRAPSTIIASLVGHRRTVYKRPSGPRSCSSSVGFSGRLRNAEVRQLQDLYSRRHDGQPIRGGAHVASLGPPASPAPFCAEPQFHFIEIRFQGLRNWGMEPMDLPDWTLGLAEQGFDCSPPKQPLAQVGMNGDDPGPRLRGQLSDLHRQPATEQLGKQDSPALTTPDACGPCRPQVTLKDGNTLRVSALSRPGAPLAEVAPPLPGETGWSRAQLPQQETCPERAVVLHYK